MIFLGREIGEQRNYSDDVAKMIDDEVRGLIERGYARATEVLTIHRDRLMALADKLIAEESVEAEEFEKLFSDLPPKENLHGISLAMPPAASTPAESSPKTTPAAKPSPEPSPS
jgi:cell division protease FtsH